MNSNSIQNRRFSQHRSSTSSGEGIVAPSVKRNGANFSPDAYEDLKLKFKKDPKIKKFNSNQRQRFQNLIKNQKDQLKQSSGKKQINMELYQPVQQQIEDVDQDMPDSSKIIEEQSGEHTKSSHWPDHQIIIKQEPKPEYPVGDQPMNSVMPSNESMSQPLSTMNQSTEPAVATSNNRPTLAINPTHTQSNTQPISPTEMDKYQSQSPKLPAAIMNHKKNERLFSTPKKNKSDAKEANRDEDEVNIDEYDNEIEVIRLDDNSRQLVSIPADHTVERKSRMMSQSISEALNRSRQGSIKGSTISQKHNEEFKENSMKSGGDIGDTQRMSQYQQQQKQDADQAYCARDIINELSRPATNGRAPKTQDKDGSKKKSIGEDMSQSISSYSKAMQNEQRSAPENNYPQMNTSAEQTGTNFMMGTHQNVSINDLMLKLDDMTQCIDGMKSNKSVESEQKNGKSSPQTSRNAQLDAQLANMEAINSYMGLNLNCKDQTNPTLNNDTAQSQEQLRSQMSTIRDIQKQPNESSTSNIKVESREQIAQNPFNQMQGVGDSTPELNPTASAEQSLGNLHQMDLIHLNMQSAEQNNKYSGVTSMETSFKQYLNINNSRMPTAFQANDEMGDYQTPGQQKNGRNAASQERSTSAQRMIHVRNDDAIDQLERTIRNQQQIRGDYIYMNQISEYRKQRDCQQEVNLSSDNSTFHIEDVRQQKESCVDKKLANKTSMQEQKSSRNTSNHNDNALNPFGNLQQPNPYSHLPKGMSSEDHSSEQRNRFPYHQQPTSQFGCGGRSSINESKSGSDGCFYTKYLKEQEGTDTSPRGDQHPQSSQPQPNVANQFYYKERIMQMERTLLEQEHQIQMKNKLLGQMQDGSADYQGRCKELEEKVRELEKEMVDKDLIIKQAKANELCWKQRYDEMLEVSRERVDHVVGRQRDELEARYNQKLELMNEENKLVRKELLKLQAELEKNQQTDITQGILNNQLKEMTDVLEEFDLKYSKKEKALQTAKKQNQQLKDAFDNIKKSQLEAEKVYSDMQMHHEKERNDLQVELQQVRTQLQLFQDNESRINQQNLNTQDILENKDSLIKDQQGLIKELREQLDVYQHDQERQSNLISNLREKIDYHKAENKSNRSRSGGRSGARRHTHNGGADTRFTNRTTGVGTIATNMNLMDPNQSHYMFNSDTDQGTTIYKTIDHQTHRSINELNYKNGAVSEAENKIYVQNIGNQQRGLPMNKSFSQERISSFQPMVPANSTQESRKVTHRNNQGKIVHQKAINSNIVSQEISQRHLVRNNQTQKNFERVESNGNLNQMRSSGQLNTGQEVTGSNKSDNLNSQIDPITVLQKSQAFRNNLNTTMEQMKKEKEATRMLMREHQNLQKQEEKQRRMNDNRSHLIGQYILDSNDGHSRTQTEIPTTNSLSRPTTTGGTRRHSQFARDGGTPQYITQPSTSTMFKKEEPQIYFERGYQKVSKEGFDKAVLELGANSKSAEQKSIFNLQTQQSIQTHSSTGLRKQVENIYGSQPQQSRKGPLIVEGPQIMAPITYDQQFFEQSKKNSVNENRTLMTTQPSIFHPDQKQGNMKTYGSSINENLGQIISMEHISQPSPQQPAQQQKAFPSFTHLKTLTTKESQPQIANSSQKVEPLQAQHLLGQESITPRKTQLMPSQITSDSEQKMPLSEETQPEQIISKSQVLEHDIKKQEKRFIKKQNELAQMEKELEYKKKLNFYKEQNLKIN